MLSYKIIKSLFLGALLSKYNSSFITVVLCPQLCLKSHKYIVSWGKLGGKKASLVSKNEFAFLSKALMCHSGRTESSNFISQIERKNDPTMGGIV